MKGRKIPKIAEKMPVARFWYKGHHTHPLFKVGLVIADRTDRDIITMYLLRDGSKVFPIGEIPIRSFRRDRIARFYSLRKEVRNRLGVPASNETTFQRQGLAELVAEGC